jgi:hypothetical protein
MQTLYLTQLHLELHSTIQNYLCRRKAINLERKKCIRALLRPAAAAALNSVRIEESWRCFVFARAVIYSRV